MRIAHACLPALLLISLGGCIQTKDCVDRCLADCRNRCYAEMAWFNCKSNYNDVEYKCDFGKGFKDGYVNVAAGGTICQPALPPRHYWQFCYQTPEGQEQMLAWFNGYSYGALYAEQEGIADWSRVVTAPTLPPFRKRRPARTASTVEDVPVEGNDGLAPPPEPMPPNEPAAPPSASVDVIDLDEQQADDGRAGGSEVRWTDAADGY